MFTYVMPQAAYAGTAAHRAGVQPMPQLKPMFTDFVLQPYSHK